MRRAVFLDRDGVVNRAVVREGKPYPPASLEALEVLDGVPEALESLRAAGYLLVLVTNQPDVATGKQLRETVESMHGYLASRLPLDAIYVCYHTDADNCACRKPKPGMLLEAARAHGLDLRRSFMVGDRWRDVEAGRASGCHTVLVEAGYHELRVEPDHSVLSLWEASQYILSR